MSALPQKRADRLQNRSRFVAAEDLATSRVTSRENMGQMGRSREPSETFEG